MWTGWLKTCEEFDSHEDNWKRRMYFFFAHLVIVSIEIHSRKKIRDVPPWTQEALGQQDPVILDELLWRKTKYGGV